MHQPSMREMSAFAYACIHPYLEKPLDPSSWGMPIDRFYIDQVLPDQPHTELQQLLHDCCMSPPEAVFLRQVIDLGESVQAVLDCLQCFGAQGIKVFCRNPNGQPTYEELTLNDPQTLLWLSTTIPTELLSQRLKAGHAANRLQEIPPPGRPPYGYRRGRYRYALDRTAAPVVKSFFDHFILYGSIRGSVKFLEKTYGKRISASTAQRWLNHPAYRGDLRYQDGTVLRDTHTAIISREEAAQVDRLLRRNRRLPPKTASAERSLAGLVQCAECQSKLTIAQVTDRRKQRYLYLRPLHCAREKPCKAIPYAGVLERSVQTICQELPEATQLRQQPSHDSPKAVLLAEIQHKEIIQNQIPDLVQQGVLDEVTGNLRRYTLRSELSQLQQQLSQLPPENFLEIVQTLSSEQFWKDLSESERRVYFREFIKTINIVRQGEQWGVEIQFVFS